MEKCTCCGGKFEKKAKGYQRTEIRSRFKRTGTSVAEVLHNLYDVTITPNKDIFVCDNCTSLITTMAVKRAQVEETETRFRKVKLAGGYISCKIPATPTHTRNFSKRQKTIVATPLKTPGQTKSESVKRKVVTVNNTKLGNAIQQMAKGRYLSGLRQLLNYSKSARSAAVHIMQDIVRSEAKLYSKSTSKSVNLQSLVKFEWSSVIKEAQDKCPALLSIVTASLTSKKRQKSKTKKKGEKIISMVPQIGSILNIIAFHWSTRCSVFQQMNSLMMWLGGCKRKVFGGFNRLGLAMSIDATRRNIDNYKQDYDTKVINWKNAVSVAERNVRELEGDLWEDVEFEMHEEVMDTIPQISDDQSDTQSSQLQELKSEDLEPKSTTEETIPYSEEMSTDIEDYAYFDITFDNVNQKKGLRHHFRGKENKILNMVQAYATKDRVITVNLSNELPSADAVRNIPITAFIVCEEDERLLKEELGIMIKRILSTHMAAFKELKDRVVWSIPHAHSTESALKNDIVPLGIVQKDETKTAEVIELLDIYKKYVPAKLDGNPLPIILYCDGLSCERVDGAQKARINGGDPWHRLEMFEPCIQEWHKRLLHMQDTYDQLFMFESHREKGTLYNIKQVFDHRGVSHNIMECFNKAEDLLEFATKGYLILAAMEILNLKSIDDIIDDSKEQLYTILSDVSKTIVDNIYQKSNTNEIINVVVDKSVATSPYCVCKLESGGDMIYCFNKNCQFGQWFHLECIGLSGDAIPEGSWFCSDICRNERASVRGKKKKTVVDKFRDLKKEYAETLIWRGLNEMIRHDAIKENDGLRMIRHWKADMPELFENNHPKYFIFAHRLLANIAGATSARLREQMIWNRTINANGGARNNIPKDLHCEHLNRQYKENSRDAGGQLTDATINRHSQMLGIGKILETVYQEQIVSSRVVERHHTRHEMDTDLKQFVKIMKPLRLLEHIPGRYFKGFENLKKTKGVTHPRNFKERIKRHTAKMANLRELVLNN